jgi:hypothetical protein
MESLRVFWRTPMRFVVSLAGALVLLTGNAPAQDLATGKWSLAVNLGDVGSGTATFTLTQTGQKLSGRYTGALGDADVTGTVVGDVIEFAFESQAGTVRYQGRISGDVMEGTCAYGQLGRGTFKGQRVPSQG